MHEEDKSLTLSRHLQADGKWVEGRMILGNFVPRQNDNDVYITGGARDEGHVEFGVTANERKVLVTLMGIDDWLAG